MIGGYLDDSQAPFCSAPQYGLACDIAGVFYPASIEPWYGLTFHIFHTLSLVDSFF